MRFSIVMPVYNVERYLPQAIGSVLSQTYKNFELILVDDASPDKSGEICDNFALKDKRIKVIHKQKNQGLGPARNIGFEQSTGDYIIYMDSDDTISPIALETVQKYLTNKTDILIFGVNSIHQNKRGRTYYREKLTPPFLNCDTKAKIGKLVVTLNKKGVFPFAWNKVYKREFLKRQNAEFFKTKLIEDFLFNIKILYRARLVTVIPDRLYNYRRPHHQTLVNTYNPYFFCIAKRKHILEIDFLENTHQKTESNLQYVYFMYIKHLFSYFLRNKIKSYKEQKKLIIEALEDELTTHIFEHYKPHGKEKIIFGILKTKKPLLCLITAKTIGFLKKNFKRSLKKVLVR